MNGPEVRDAAARVIMIRRAPWLHVVLAALLPTIVAGCGDSGPRRYPVSGTITFDDKPLPDGEVIFFPADGSAQPDAGKIADGKFSFRSLPGKKRVEIRADRLSKTKTIPVDGGGGKAKWIPAREVYIPPQYNTESKLFVEVQPDGPRDFDFQLRGNRRDGQPIDASKL
jgi:hypothetical protein